MYLFNDITLLITHYNRSYSLEKLLKSFVSIEVSFAEIIVSDDGSNENHIKYLHQLKVHHQFNLLTTPLNKGLGNNINKGQDAVKTKYTLYIQEDFVPELKLIKKLKIANQFLEEDDDLDFVRFYAYTLFPNLIPYKEGFSLMTFNHFAFWETYRKFYIYSDHPHLRRSTFLEKFGRYTEHTRSDRTEYNMMMQVLSVGVKAYFYKEYKSLLEQENSVTEPSSVKRNFWRENQNILITIVRHIYRYLRFYLELIIFKLRKKK